MHLLVGKLKDISQVRPLLTPFSNCLLLHALTHCTQRGKAINDLSEIRDECTDLSLSLAHNPGVVTILLQEITSAYGLLSSERLTQAAGARVCCAIRLLQVIADDSRTRPGLLSAHIHLWLYPFLHTTSHQRPFAFLRCSALGVIAGLVRSSEPHVVHELMMTGIVPVLLSVCETDATCPTFTVRVAVFVLQCLVLDRKGLEFVCASPSRFGALTRVLGIVLARARGERGVPRIVKDVLKIFVRLAEHRPGGREAVKRDLPLFLMGGEFAGRVREDEACREWYEKLLGVVGFTTISYGS